MSAALRAVVVCALLGGAAGCNGYLSIFPSSGETSCSQNSDCSAGLLCIEGTCQFGNGGLCWIYNEEGNCPPSGSTCVDGVCAKTATSWCECDPETTECLDGGCVEPSEDTSCSAFLPNGSCVAGSVCVAGTCVVINIGNICSINRLGGLCPSGSGCEGGVCVPISDDPCGPANLDGLCPSGSSCAADGTCVYVPCSASNPNGACETLGDYCDNGQCVALPCSPQNVNGPCDDSGQFCSTTGTCIPNGTCQSNGDCTDGNFCASNNTCITDGTCINGNDCDDYSVCTSNVCVRDTTCTDDTRCPSGEHCLGEPSGQCGPTYACVDDTDCQSGYFCSISLGECTAQNECYDDSDCALAGHCTVASGQCICSSTAECIAKGSCAADADCGYGQRCSTDSSTCAPISPCNTNDDCVDGSGNPRDDELCSSTGPLGTESGLCVTVGRCRTDADCAPGLLCNQTDNTCSKSTTTSPSTCTVDSDCGSGKYCTYYSVCATGSNTTASGDGTGDCGSAADCAAPRICTNSFTCAVSSACGGDVFQATLVQPNMLVLLDRSGSMNEAVGGSYDLGTTQCPDQSAKRWSIAVDAINQVVSAQSGKIRFGLSTYPSRNKCGGSQDCSANCNTSCTNGCNVTSIPSGSSKNDNCEPGYVDVAVSSPVQNIIDSLAGNDPGGRTPTARALAVIADSPASYGLPATSDTTPRDNYLLLVTDGDPNCAGAVTCPAACLNTDGSCKGQNCIVNYELGRLQGLATPIKTFTVGFAFSSVNANLNCNAVYGGTSLCDSTVTTSNCSSKKDKACYYQANDAAALVSAFNDITRSVSGCTFTLDRRPPDVSQLFVFTQASGSSTYVEVSKDSSNPDGYYTYDDSELKVQFYGAVCDDIRDGSVTPSIVYGCANPSG